MDEIKWLSLPKESGYLFGVEAEGTRVIELHGGFTTVEQAFRYLRMLSEEYSYASLKVVKIETPEVSLKGERVLSDEEAKRELDEMGFKKVGSRDPGTNPHFTGRPSKRTIVTVNDLDSESAYSTDRTWWEIDRTEDGEVAATLLCFVASNGYQRGKVNRILKENVLSICEVNLWAKEV